MKDTTVLFSGHDTRSTDPEVILGLSVILQAFEDAATARYAYRRREAREFLLGGEMLAFWAERAHVEVDYIIRRASDLQAQDWPRDVAEDIIREAHTWQQNARSRSSKRRTSDSTSPSIS